MRRSPFRGDPAAGDRALLGRSAPAVAESVIQTPPEAPSPPQVDSGLPGKEDDEGAKESAFSLRRRRPPWCPPEEPCPPERPPWSPPEITPPPVEPPWGRPGGPQGPGSGPSWPPGSSFPRTVQLAEAFVPWQVYSGYCMPSQMKGPGTIFPELLRTPPLYQYPPGTGGRRG